MVATHHADADQAGAQCGSHQEASFDSGVRAATPARSAFSRRRTYHHDDREAEAEPEDRGGDEQHEQSSWVGGTRDIGLVDDGRADLCRRVVDLLDLVDHRRKHIGVRRCHLGDPVGVRARRRHQDDHGVRHDADRHGRIDVGAEGFRDPVGHDVAAGEGHVGPDPPGGDKVALVELLWVVGRHGGGDEELGARGVDVALAHGQCQQRTPGRAASRRGGCPTLAGPPGGSHSGARSSSDRSVCWSGSATARVVTGWGTVYCGPLRRVERRDPCAPSGARSQSTPRLRRTASPPASRLGGDR